MTVQYLPCTSGTIYRARNTVGFWSNHSLGKDIKFRHDYRNATSPLAKQMIAATEAFASREVRTKLAARFARLAAPGVPRT